MEAQLKSIYDQLRSDKDFSFTAIVGQEGLCTTYTANVPLGILVQAFKPVPFNPNSKLLIQRETQKGRISKIDTYLEYDYASFPSAGAIVESLSVKKVNEFISTITLNASSFRYIFDGQGRLGGVASRLLKSPSLATHTLTVKFYTTLGFSLDNQRFSDWNGAQSKPNRSICQSMDSRVLLNTYVKRVIENLPAIVSRVDYTKASIPAKSGSNKLWSLNQINSFVQLLVGVTEKTAETLLEDEKDKIKWQGFITKYFEMLSKSSEQFKQALQSDENALKARQETIIGTSVWLKSMGLTGRVIALYLIEKGGKADWSFMSALSEIDFSRSNKEWLGRCMDFRGVLQDRAFNHKAMTVYILDTLGIPLPTELESIEEEVMIAKASVLKAKREQDKQQTLNLEGDAA